MSVGSNLQEMENVVTKGAAPAEPMPSAGIPVEDLGGPTPENYRSDDDSAKLSEPASSLKQVKDVVNMKANRAEENEVDDDQEVVSEDSENIEESEEVIEQDYEEEIAEESAEEVEEPEYDIEEDVSALLSGEELSEEFQEKARIIFESAINAKVQDIKKSLEEQYENTLIEEINSMRESIIDRVDSYLEYVSDEWFQENALAVEKGLKTEMTESFLEGIKGLFEDHYVSIPEDKYDVLESMVDKLDEMELKLNEQIEKNIALNNRLAESTADIIFADVSEGLAYSQREKFASLAENVEFESETDYREKLVTLRKSYFPEQTSTPKSTSENLSEEVSVNEVISEEISPIMKSYLDTLSRSAKK